MNIDEVMSELEKNGSEQTKKVLSRHGAREPFFGVKVEFLKKLQKKIKTNHPLALELYATGNSDAMYLASMIADTTIMTKRDIQKWTKEAYWYLLNEYAIPSVTASHKEGLAIALKWIDKKEEKFTSAGWATLSVILSTIPNDELGISEFKNLLNRVAKEIHTSSSRTRYTMNGFVISVGAYIPELTKSALQTANKIGKVSVSMGETSCKVPFATDYINKIIAMDRVGKKRK
jgi:3-methyladenine DNA glycosylase AlkD